MALVFLAFLGRAIHLQVVSSQELTTLAQRQHNREEVVKAARGAIYDRNGQKLVESINAVSIFANPREIDDVERTSRQLATLTGQAKASLIARLTSSEGNFVWIARQLEPEKAEAIKKANIPGIYFRFEPKRYHYYGKLLAPVIGVVGVDLQGLEGLELSYDKHLRGVRDNVMWAVDAKGNRLYRPSPPSSSQDEAKSIVLTIDSNLQHIVDKHLTEAMQETKAKGGVAIVADPFTGEILAFSVLPSFDPSTFREQHVSIGNPAITNVFEPGSIFKPFLVAAAIEAGVVKPQSKIYCENGSYRLTRGVTIREAGGKRFGMLSVAEILKVSSNIGCAKIGKKLGRERTHEYLQNFGFGSPTGIDAPGESQGLIKPANTWTLVDTANIAFGQGVGVSALQLVNALSAIANGGNLMKPYLVKRVVNSRGQVILENKPTVVRRVISETTAQQITKMLTNVVESPNGTGQLARVDNIAIAGKTGTAQKYDHKKRGFSREKVVASFEGFMPADKPHLVLLVSIDEPQLNRWGGIAAAPVFKKISEEILSRNLAGIIPQSQHLASGDVLASEVLRVDVQLASQQAADVSQNAEALEKALKRLDDNKVPDFKGLTIRDALRIAAARNIEISLKGSGWAYMQKPAAGQMLSGGNRSCEVYFSDGGR